MIRVCLYLDRSRVFCWHLWLAEALTAISGYQVSAVFAPESHPLPWSCRLLFELERLVYRNGPATVAPAGALLSEAVWTEVDCTAQFDVVIDLAGDGSCRLPAIRVLLPCFDGSPCEIGLIAALAEWKTPQIAVHDSARPGERWLARPALNDGDVLSRSVDNMLSCAARLLLKAVQHRPAAVAVGRDEAPLLDPVAHPPPVGAAVVARAASGLAHKMERLLGIMVKGSSSWAAAWRFAGAGSLFDHRKALFRLQPDDGQRYYADPFPFCRGGRNFVFVEEFPYTVGRGCISVFEIDAAGNAGTPRAVLEEAYHLSYPFVFESDGEVWMLPEAGEARGVYLYRAEQFPGKWRREGCLVSGVEAYDATLWRGDGGFWLSLCERAWNSSGWDMMSLFHADTLTGNWLPHPGNPVVMDASLSRPGGAVFSRNGVKYRPAQDCSRLYGGAISVCRIDVLQPEIFRQTVVGRIYAGRLGCHTYNRCGDIEVVDVFGDVRGLVSAAAFFAPTSREPTITATCGDRPTAAAAR